MDVTLSTKTQTLTLNSYTTLLSSLSPTKPHSIRRQFLGYTHTLRPPGTNCNPLRSRTKFKNLWFQNGSPRFYVKASLYSNSVLVVVAVATFSALSLVFYHQYNKRKSLSEVSVSPFFVLSQLAKDIVSHIIDCETLVFGELQRETSAKEREYVSEKMKVNSDASQDKNFHHQLQETALMHDDSIMTRTSETPGADLLVAGAINYVPSKGSEAAGPSLPSAVLPESGGLQPLIFPTEMSGLQGENIQNGTESESEFPGLRVRTKSSAALVPTSNACTLVNEHSKVNLENGGEGEFIGYSTALGESVRESFTNSMGQTNQ